MKKQIFIQEFIQDLNAQRRKTPNQWIQMFRSFNGVEVKSKSFGTWVQLLYIGDIKRSGPMDCNVGTMKKFLEDSLNESIMYI